MVKPVPTQMQTDLDSGATTHCHCWAVAIQGQTLGFTDHDEDLTFESVVFKAETGMDASALARTDGLRVDDMDAVGILDDASITSEDIAAGLYDGALVTIWKVDWSNVANRVIMMRGPIGAISRGQLAYRAQLKSISAFSDVRTGQTYVTKCRHNLGDDICRVSLTGGFSSTGTVATAESRRIFTTTTAGIVARAAEWFTGGRLTWSSGLNNGRAIEVRFHNLFNNVATFELIEPMPRDIAPGDGFTVLAGCGKTIEICRSKFNNVLNFGGFPRIPQQDFVLSYPKREDLNDGGSLF